MPAELRGLFTGALATVALLVGGMILSAALGNALFEGVSGHMLARAGLGALPAFGGVLGVAAIWGWVMGRLVDPERALRYARAGLLGFGLPSIAAVLLLLALESAVLSLSAGLGVREFPVHRLFTVLFVPTAFTLTSLGAYALARLRGDQAWARRLALQSGALAALAFLLVNLVMEARGWVVGAPGAAERFTMVTVLLVGMVAAALAGGAALGRGLATRETEETARKEYPENGHPAQSALRGESE